VETARRGALSRVDIELAVANVRILREDQLNDLFDLSKARDRWWLGDKLLVPKLPNCVKPMFARVLLQASRLVRMFPRSERAWDILFAIPFLLLQRWEKFRVNSIASINVLAARCLRFATWDIEELARDAATLQQENALISGSKAHASAQGGSGRSNRFEQLMREQRLGEALKELKRNGGGMGLQKDAAAEQVVNQKLGQGPVKYIDTIAILKDMRSKNELPDVTITTSTLYHAFTSVNKTKGGGFVRSDIPTYCGCIGGDGSTRRAVTGGGKCNNNLGQRGTTNEVALLLVRWKGRNSGFEIVFSRKSVVSCHGKNYAEENAGEETSKSGGRGSEATVCVQLWSGYSRSSGLCQVLGVGCWSRTCTGQTWWYWSAMRKICSLSWIEHRC
jgi:hypothetical protein